MTPRNYLKQKKQSHFTQGGIEVIIKDELIYGEKSSNFSVKDVIGFVTSRIPKSLLTNVDVIYVGNFDFLNKRSVQAMYDNSSIFVTNRQDNFEDMCDDIIHEIAHSVEEIKNMYIYTDGLLESEFIIKRKQLYSTLKSEGFCEDVDLQTFLEIEYAPSFDNFLYKEVGYSALSVLAASIFYSPYAATSLREYFANGFEAYYCHQDVDFLQKACPKLYAKILGLTGEEYEK